MYQSNFQQLSVPTTASSVQNALALIPVAQNDSGTPARAQLENGAHSQAEASVDTTKKFQNDLQKAGLRIKQHEDNIKFLRTQKNSLDEAILDLQVTIGKYHSTNGIKTEAEDLPDEQSKDETVEHILRHEKSAAGVFCQMKTRHGTLTQASNIPQIKDVLGIVATLGKVDDDKLSRLLSEYLGTETMLALVCKTFDGVKTLEVYDGEGTINKTSGLHGLGSSIGRTIDERYLAICLEHLRPYVGEFIANDPQRRLDLIKPRLPGGELPSGFLGFAVNMIHIDGPYLFCLTRDGHGLRETLFYHLFSRLQVYRTREDMHQALPFITDGAVSLDGGIMRRPGVFSLGNRGEVDVKFPKNSGKPSLPGNFYEIENSIRDKKWAKDRMVEEIRREQGLLDQEKYNFEIKKKEFVQFIAQSSQSAPVQVQVQQQHPFPVAGQQPFPVAGQGRLTPR